jgi:hypothetical protein
VGRLVTQRGAVIQGDCERGLVRPLVWLAIFIVPCDRRQCLVEERQAFRADAGGQVGESTARLDEVGLVDIVDSPYVDRSTGVVQSDEEEPRLREGLLRD